MPSFASRSAAADVLTRADHGDYTGVGSGAHPHHLPGQSALCALGWAGIDVARAYRELETVLGARDESGMVASIAYEYGSRGYTPGPSAWGQRVSADGRRISGLSAFPLPATCLRLLFDVAPDTQRALALLPALHAWHTFLLTDRNFLGTNEPALIHPAESGRDEAEEWVAPLRRAATEAGVPMAAIELELVAEGTAAHWRQFQLATAGRVAVLDPGFTASLAAACADVAHVASALGLDTMAAESELLGFNVAQALAARADDDGLTRPYDARFGEVLDVLGIGSALMLLSSSLTVPHVATLRKLVLHGELSSPFGVRTLASDELAASAELPHRGAVSLPLTWLCALGLERHGEKAAAQLLRSRADKACTFSGFAEHVHADSGVALSQSGHAATAALWLWNTL